MRKHHNRLYFGKYSHKATFKVPDINKLYPTTDYYLDRLVQGQKLNTALLDTIEFIKSNRKKMKFRIQNRSCIFYAQKELIFKAINSLWSHWVGVNSIDMDKNKIYDNNTVVCKRLPLGKYQYQIHTKRDMYDKITPSQRQLLYQYLTQNLDNATITNRNLKQWLSGAGAIHYDLNGYFYVKNEKALMPIYMISNHIIDKIVKFVKV